MSIQPIYLDYNSTTPLHPEVAKCMTRHVRDFGNPSSMHYHGQRAKALLESSRVSIAKLLGALPDQLIFQSSGSEANNQMMNSFAQQSSESHPVHVIISSIEHSCIKSCLEWTHYPFFSVTAIPVQKNGSVLKTDIEAAITPHTKLISVMAANNETGTYQPLADIIDIAHKNGCLIHTDAVQTLGKMPFDVQTYPVDFATLSAHKCYGPKGIAVLYAKQDNGIAPLIYGGPQEYLKRAGTENVTGIAAMAKAFEIAVRDQEDDAKRFQKMKDEVILQLKSMDDYWINGDVSQAIPNTINLSFSGIKGVDLVMHLDLNQISISTGSACSTGAVDPSHVISALTNDPDRIHGAIRISWGKFTTDEQIDRFIQILPKSVKKLRG